MVEPESDNKESKKVSLERKPSWWKKPQWLLGSVLGGLLIFNIYLTDQTRRQVGDGPADRAEIAQLLSSHESKTRIAFDAKEVDEEIGDARDALSFGQKPESVMRRLEKIAEKLVGIRQTPIALDEAMKKKVEWLESQFISRFEEAKKKYYQATSAQERLASLEDMFSILDQWKAAIENLLARNPPANILDEQMALEKRRRWRAKTPLVQHKPYPPAINGRDWTI